MALLGVLRLFTSIRMSAGGTIIASIYALEANNVRNAFMCAVEAADNRTKVFNKTK
jgi:pyrroline-5-carboxylate reductase